jgi:alpha-galactosidase
VEGPLPAPDASGGLALDCWTFDGLYDLAGMDAAAQAPFAPAEAIAVQYGGWQSWSAGWELQGRETLPRRVRLIPELIKQTNREGDRGPPRLPELGIGGKTRARDWLPGHFIIYLRAGDRYCCAASRDGGLYPPVTFRINRKTRLIAVEAFCPGKTWKKGDVLGEIHIFFVQGYFNLKDTLRRIYQQEGAFQRLDFLRAAGKNKGRLSGGYASWYNHYTNITEAIILEDLDALGKTENLIKRWYLDRKKPVVFQIDDGWERAVGEWEADTRRFPQGLAPVAAKIEEAGYIPGLWIAPFLATKRSRLYTERPGWLLQDGSGRPVAAGFNHLWDKQFYCLDLSRADVLEYLRGIIDRIIDGWGFRYLKLDFLYTGFFSGAFAEGGSPYEHYERACAVLSARGQTASGRRTGFLGCGLPLGPSYRHFPLARIGADTREEWDWRLAKWLNHTGRPGAYMSLRDTIGRSFMDGAVYVNDPDVVFLRSTNCKLREHEKELIALVNFLLGGQIMISDDPRRLKAADLALTRRITELYDLLADDEYGPLRLDRDVFRLDSQSGKIRGLINLRNRPYYLQPEKDPALFAFLSKGTCLVDHRLQPRRESAGFAPHTITLVRH